MPTSLYNPFDLTKAWPHKDYPLIEVGILECRPTSMQGVPEAISCARSATSPKPTRLTAGVSLSAWA